MKPALLPGILLGGCELPSAAGRPDSASGVRVGRGRPRADMVEMDPGLRSRYEHGYESGESEWRRIGAVAKARHIQMLSAGNEYDAVLEVGAGEGSLLARLSEVGFGGELAALEVSETAVTVLKARGIPRLASAALFDGYHVRFPDDRFDLAILSHVLEHVEHPRALLLEVKRVAREVFVEVPLELHLRTPRDFVPSSTGHINLFSPVVVRQLIQSVGMSMVREQIFNADYPVFRYRSGRFALPHYLLKRTVLTVFPFLAVRLFTFHWCGLCRT